MLFSDNCVKLYNAEQRSEKDGRCRESRLWSGNQIKTGWKPCWGTGVDFCTWWGCYWSVFNLVRLFSNGSMNRHLKREKLKAGRPVKK